MHLRSLALVALATATLLAPLASCTSTGPLAQPSVEFTKAARGFVDTLGAEYAAYVEADEELTLTERTNRLDAIGDFEFAVRQAEKAHGLAAQGKALESGEMPGLASSTGDKGSGVLELPGPPAVALAGEPR